MSMIVSRFAPETVHQQLFADVQPELGFDSSTQFSAWQIALRDRLRTVVGAMPDPVPLDVRVEWTATRDGYTETRFVFTAERGAEVPCHLLVPSSVTRPVPAVICLQGHSPGMHVSLGRQTYSGERRPADGDRDFALHVIAGGYAALVMEQRCFGERRDARPPELREAGKNTCHHASHAASLVGRTMVGERVWDVSRAIDALVEFDRVDTSRIACMGNSGGGVISWYAACLDQRISAVMPSCSFSPYATSIGTIEHCCDNYLPGALLHFDMPDLAGLIVPRPLVIVNGRDDTLFPIEGVREGYETVAAIYAASGTPDRCALVVGDGGHRFYAADAWPVFKRLTGWSE